MFEFRRLLARRAGAAATVMNRAQHALEYGPDNLRPLGPERLGYSQTMDAAKNRLMLALFPISSLGLEEVDKAHPELAAFVITMMNELASRLEDLQPHDQAAHPAPLATNDEP